MKRAMLFAGLPASGKTTAADIGAAITGGDTIHSGQMIREMASQDGLENPSSEELADFAATVREDHGSGVFAERTVGMILRDEIEVGYPLFVDSIRHMDAFIEFAEFFDSTQLVFLEVDRTTRLERINERGRDGEDEFDLYDLAKRDTNEIENLGLHSVRGSDRIDHTIDNSGTERDLRESLEAIVGQW